MRSAHDSGVRVVAVLGLGTMGQGIAEVCARAGFEVRGFDDDAGQANRARSALGSQVTITASLADACAAAGLVIEAIPESLDQKAALFAQAERASLGNAILASNTSSLSISELADRIAEPSRFLGMHFFNPPAKIELLEVVTGPKTAPEVVRCALAFAAAIGKTAIVVRDAPGFATSRLGVALGAEAMRMVEQGVASVADIDRAMELGYRHAMGPLKVTDLVGLDVRLAILERLERELGDRFRPPDILRKLVALGRLGKKVGVGFYRWTDAGPVAEPWD